MCLINISRPAELQGVGETMIDLSRYSIVFVNNFNGPHLGGGEVYLLHLLRGAIGAGMKTTVIAMPFSDLAKAASNEGAAVVAENLMKGNPLAVASRLAGHLRTASADIVHGTGYYTNILSRLAGAKAGCWVVNSVLCEPESTLAIRKGPKDKLVQWSRTTTDRFTSGKADAIIAGSVALKSALASQGLDPERIYVIHNSIDPDAIRAQAAKEGMTPDYSDGGILIGTLGRLEPIKGLSYLLDAAKMLVDSNNELRFLIAGEGAEEPKLRDRISKDPILSRFVRLLGFVPNAVSFLSHLNIYCLPSLSEGFNTTILEAFALGVPVVATDVGGTSEVVKDGVTGYLVQPADSRALADAISRLLKNPSLGHRMGKTGRDWVNKHFNIKEMTAKTLDVYAKGLAAEQRSKLAKELDARHN